MEKGLSRDARAIGERSALRRIISASNCYYNREQRTRTPPAVADDADNEKNRLQKKRAATALGGCENNCLSVRRR